MNAELAAEGKAKHCHHNGVSGGGLIKEHHRVVLLIGVDVGKSNRHAVELDRNGKLLDRAFSQDEAELLSITASLARNGPLLLVVDQPAKIGALPVAVAQTKCINVAYLPRAGDAPPQAQLRVGLGAPMMTPGIVASARMITAVLPGDPGPAVAAQQ